MGSRPSFTPNYNHTFPTPRRHLDHAMFGSPSMTPLHPPNPSHPLSMSQYTFCLPESDDFNGISSLLEPHRNMPPELQAELETLRTDDIGGPDDFTINMIDWFANMPRSPPPIGDSENRDIIEATIASRASSRDTERPNKTSAGTSGSSSSPSARSGTLAPSFRSPSAKESMTSMDSPDMKTPLFIPLPQISVREPEGLCDVSAGLPSERVSSPVLASRPPPVTSSNSLAAETTTTTKTTNVHINATSTVYSSPIYQNLSVLPNSDVPSVHGVSSNPSMPTPFHFPSDGHFFSPSYYVNATTPTDPPPSQSSARVTTVRHLHSTPAHFPVGGLRSDNFGFPQTRSFLTSTAASSLSRRSMESIRGESDLQAAVSSVKQVPTLGTTNFGSVFPSQKRTVSAVLDNTSILFPRHTTTTIPPLSSSTNHSHGFNHSVTKATSISIPSHTKPVLMPSPELYTPGPAAVPVSAITPAVKPSQLPGISDDIRTFQATNASASTGVSTPLVKNIRTPTFGASSRASINVNPFRPQASFSGLSKMQFTPVSKTTKAFPLYPNSGAFGSSNQFNFNQSFTPRMDYSHYSTPGADADSDNGIEEDKESKAIYLDAMLAAAQRETEELENELMTGVCQAQTQDPSRSPNKRYPLDFETRPLHEVIHQLRVDLHKSWKDHCSKFETQEQGYLGELSGRLDVENQYQRVSKVNNELETTLEKNTETIRDLENRLETLSLRKPGDDENPSAESDETAAALQEQLTYTKRRLEDVTAAKIVVESEIAKLTDYQRLEMVVLNEQLLREKSRAEFLEQQTKTQDREINDLRSSLKNAQIQVAQSQAAGDFRPQMEFLQNMVSSEQERCASAWKLLETKEATIEDVRGELAATKDMLSSVQISQSKERTQQSERLSSMLSQFNAVQKELAAETDMRRRLESDGKEYGKRVTELECQLEEMAAAQLTSPTELPHHSSLSLDTSMLDLLRDELDQEKSIRQNVELQIASKDKEIELHKTEIAYLRSLELAKNDPPPEVNQTPTESDKKIAESERAVSDMQRKLQKGEEDLSVAMHMLSDVQCSSQTNTHELTAQVLSLENGLLSICKYVRNLILKLCRSGNLESLNYAEEWSDLSTFLRIYQSWDSTDDEVVRSLKAPERTTDGVDAGMKIEGTEGLFAEPVESVPLVPKQRAPLDILSSSDTNVVVTSSVHVEPSSFSPPSCGNATTTAATAPANTYPSVGFRFGFSNTTPECYQGYDHDNYSNTVAAAPLATYVDAHGLFLPAGSVRGYTGYHYDPAPAMSRTSSQASVGVYFKGGVPILDQQPAGHSTSTIPNTNSSYRAINPPETNSLVSSHLPTGYGATTTTAPPSTYAVDSGFGLSDVPLGGRDGSNYYNYASPAAVVTPTIDLHHDSDPSISSKLSDALVELSTLKGNFKTLSQTMVDTKKSRDRALASAAALQVRVDGINELVDKRVAALIRARDQQWSDRLSSYGGSVGSAGENRSLSVNASPRLGADDGIGAVTGSRSLRVSGERCVSTSATPTRPDRRSVV